jgi:universal stress protein E
MITNAHILCAVDFSASSRTALRYAAATAGSIGARLTVLTVNDPLLVEALKSVGESEWPALEAAELRDFCRETLGRDVPLDVAVRVGRPADEIQACAADLHADLLVMGCHGLTGIRKLFFGSTTEGVLKASTIPVLVTPTDLHAPSSSRDVPSLVRRILVPVDLTPISASLVQIGAALGRALGVPVILLHAADAIEMPARWRGQLICPQIDKRAEAATALDALARTAGGQVEPMVTAGEPADAIISVAEIRAAGLIVMGLQQSGAGRVGVVAYRVLSRTHVPVLAIPAAAAEDLCREMGEWQVAAGTGV